MHDLPLLFLPFYSFCLISPSFSLLHDRKRSLITQGDARYLLITSWSTPKDDEHTQNYTHTFRRRRRMRNKRENALNHSKIHIKPFGGRKECSYTFRDALGVPIYRLQRRNDGEGDPSSSLRETSTTRVQPIFPFVRNRENTIGERKTENRV